MLYWRRSTGYLGVGVGYIVLVLLFGGVSEWFKEAVLKTVGLHGSVGSNPTPSAT